MRRLDFEYRRIRKLSLTTFALKAALKLLGVCVWFALLPVTALLHLAGYRRVTIFTDRIGHLAIEPDCLLKEQALGKIPARKWILLAPGPRVANAHLLKYWEPHFLVLRNRAACFFAASMSQFALMRHDVSHYVRAIGGTQAAFRIYRDWSKRPPLLQLTRDDIEYGNAALEALGLPQHAWFVCVHAREAGFSPVDEELHRHRNSDIDRTIPAIKEIVRRGGWAIRMGDPSMKSLHPMEHVIDIAHHRLKSDRLDIVLCARARFILGNTSGIALAGTVFGVPCALANMVPMTAMGMAATDISIPKRYWSNRESRCLRLNEALSLRLAGMQHAVSFDESGIRLEENSPDEIRELVVEMLDRLAGVSVEDETDRKLQEQAGALLAEGHYSFGAASRMGARFLRRHLAAKRNTP